jgi:hypothetical protein
MPEKTDITYTGLIIFFAGKEVNIVLYISVLPESADFGISTP